MQVKSSAECTKGSIMQYFRPSFSYHMPLRAMFCLYLSGRFTQIVPYQKFLTFCTFDQDITTDLKDHFSEEAHIICIIFSVTNVRPLVTKPKPQTTAVSTVISHCHTTTSCMANCEKGYTLGAQDNNGCPSCSCIQPTVSKYITIPLDAS